MKVLVISDTHGRTSHVCQLIERLKMHGLTHIIHCGDCIEDAKYIEHLYTELVMYKVAGNCDGYGAGGTILEYIDDVPIMITHGHRQHVKESYEEMWIDAIAHEAKLAVFGHTHIAYLERKDDIILLNPGSMTLPKDENLPSFAIIEIKKGEIVDIGLMQTLGNGEIHRKL